MREFLEFVLLLSDESGGKNGGWSLYGDLVIETTSFQPNEGVAILSLVSLISYSSHSFANFEFFFPETELGMGKNLTGCRD